MRLIRLLLTTLVILVIALVGLVLALPDDRIARLAADQVRGQTGRELTFDGKVGISWYPVFGVATGPVTLANADWSDAGPMFRAEAAAIGVDVMRLLGGEIRLTRIELIRPEVLLETHADGRANWELFPAGESPAAAAGAGAPAGDGTLLLENLKVEGARLRYLEAGTERFAIADLDVALLWPDPRRPAEIALTLRPAGKDVTLTATVADLPALLAGRLSAVVARLGAAGGTVDFDGRAGIDPQVGGRLAVALPDPGAFLSALGQPAAAPGGPLSLRGDITYTREGLVTLRDASLTALGNALNAQMDLDLSGATPQVTAHLVAGRLDLARLAGGAGGAQGGQAAPSGWSKAPIAADALSAFNGEITLAAEAIDLGSLKLDRSRLSVALDKARAVVSLREVAAYGGAVQGQLVANNRSGLSVAGKLDITGMELNGLLRDAMEIESFTGKADLKLDFLGSGASEHQIMNSLKGTAALKVGKGTITGLDLEKLLRGKTAGGVTVFDALTGSAVIEQGVLRNDDLLLELPRLIARGEGQVGIGARDINYLFTPQLRRDDDSGLAFPVRIKGSWDNPRIRPDLDKALGIDLKAEKQALKDEAKSAVTEKIGEELGVTVDPAGSVKDAAKDAARGKLEEEVKGGLRKLLNRGE